MHAARGARHRYSRNDEGALSLIPSAHRNELDTQQLLNEISMGRNFHEATGTEMAKAAQGDSAALGLAEKNSRPTHNQEMR